MDIPVPTLQYIRTKCFGTKRAHNNLFLPKNISAKQNAPEQCLPNSAKRSGPKTAPIPYMYRAVLAEIICIQYFDMY